MLQNSIVILIKVLKLPKLSSTMRMTVIQTRPWPTQRLIMLLLLSISQLDSLTYDCVHKTELFKWSSNYFDSLHAYTDGVLSMEVCCSFKSIVGGICGFDSRDRKREVEVIPVLSCTKDISKHKSVYSFSGPEDEVDLILCRAGLFRKPDNLNTMTICPLHRAKLGLRWSRGASTRCRVPFILSNHGKDKGNWPKGDRGVGKKESEVLLRKTGMFIQAGSGICRKCRDVIKGFSTSAEDSSDVVDVLGAKLDKTTLHDEDDDDEEVVFKTGPKQKDILAPQTPQSVMTSSVYTPSGISQASDMSILTQPETDEGAETAKSSPKEKLNLFLVSRDISPIRTSMTTPWDTAAERTKRHYVRKAKQAVFATLEEIAPQNSEMLFSAIQSSRKEADNIDSTLLEALVECYENASHWSTRRQILSIIADKVSFEVLQR